MELKKIFNPWEKIEGFKCFGCSPKNPIGLHLCFYEDGDEVVGKWKPSELYDGWINTLHGGIQAVIIDEVCSWAVSRKIQRVGVTMKMETRYKKPLTSNEGEIEIRAHIASVGGKTATIEARLLDSNGEICTEGTCLYYLYPEGAEVHGMGFEHCYVEGEV